MTSVLGLPLFGSLFVPLVIGVATVFLFWMFVFSKKTVHSAISKDELQKYDVSLDEAPNETIRAIKTKKKKACREGGCCTKKDKKSGCCSEQTNRAIEFVRVFVDGQTSISEYARMLLDYFNSESLNNELFHNPEPETIDLNQHADGSLCIFLIADNAVGGSNKSHWLELCLSRLKKTDNPLSGMKFTVCLCRTATNNELNGDVIDQQLHKAGAIRVCQAETVDISSAVGKTEFQHWASELLAQIKRWNAPKLKACKCAPKKMKVDQNEESHSSECSTSEEDEAPRNTEQQLLDLEDIAKLL